MLTIRAMSNAQGYSARHLEHSDYYDEHKRIAGRWNGRGAELLGLSGEVLSKDFDSIRQGLDPRSGEFLRQRQSADRKAADGATTSHGRNLYDFTFSAPKSVSIMASVGGDERLPAAHRMAVLTEPWVGYWFATQKEEPVASLQLRIHAPQGRAGCPRGMHRLRTLVRTLT